MGCVLFFVHVSTFGRNRCKDGFMDTGRIFTHVSRYLDNNQRLVPIQSSNFNTFSCYQNLVKYLFIKSIPVIINAEDVHFLTYLPL